MTQESYCEPTWENQLREARKLSTADLRRHASVSTNNRHYCRECFCCACLTVLAEMPKLTVAKLAAVREPGHPIGSSAPCWFTCPMCKARMPAYDGDHTCACDATWSANGWRVS